MKKLIPGFTGLIPKGADYFETVKRYAGYGYKLTESAMPCFCEGDPKENAKRIRDMGLELWTLGTTVQNGAYPDVKDYTRGDNFEDKPRRKVTVPRHTTPGSGIVDLQAIFMEAIKIDSLKYAIIEQDMPNKVMHDAIMQAAITNLRETGYVE